MPFRYREAMVEPPFQKREKKIRSIRFKEDIQDIINNNAYCPLDVEIIPDNMGINLCSVDSIEWTEQEDGQLVSLTINFIPENNAEEESSNIDDILNEMRDLGEK